MEDILSRRSDRLMSNDDQVKQKKDIYFQDNFNNDCPDELSYFNDPFESDTEEDSVDHRVKNPKCPAPKKGPRQSASKPKCALAFITLFSFCWTFCARFYLDLFLAGRKPLSGKPSIIKHPVPGSSLARHRMHSQRGSSGGSAARKPFRRDPTVSGSSGAVGGVEAWEANQLLIAQLRSDNTRLKKELAENQTELRTVTRQCKVQNARLSKVCKYKEIQLFHWETLICAFFRQ